MSDPYREMGRPPGRLLHNAVKVFFTEPEWNALVAAAEEDGRVVEEWISDLVAKALTDRSRPEEVVGSRGVRAPAPCEGVTMIHDALRRWDARWHWGFVDPAHPPPKVVFFAPDGPEARSMRENYESMLAVTVLNDADLIPYASVRVDIALMLKPAPTRSPAEFRAAAKKFCDNPENNPYAAGRVPATWPVGGTSAHQGERDGVQMPSEAERPSYREIVVVGHVRRASDGFLVVDACATDAEHLAAPATDGERRRCRTRLEDLFVAFVGRRARLLVTVTEVPEGEAAR